MTIRAYRTFQGLVLGALGLYLLSRIWNGSVLLYINERFIWLVVMAGIGCLILSQVVLQARFAAHKADVAKEDDLGCQDDACHAHHDHGHGAVSGWNLWWLALPVLLGLLVPARPLGTTALATRGIKTIAPINARDNSATFSFNLPASERNVLDWTRALNYAGDPAQFTDDPADVTGFVYHDPRLEEGQFMVGRFTITCCVADAFAIGMVVHWPEAEQLVDNSWVRVQGSIEIAEMEGQRKPTIRAYSVEPVPQPPQPYLFP